MSTLTWGILAGVVVSGIVAHIINQRIRNKLRIGLIARLDVDTQLILDHTVFNCIADRALVLKLHNGGKIFAGVQKYITILYEAETKNLPPIKKDFQSYEVDASYMKMIDTLIREGIEIYEVNKMPEGFLKRRYEYEGIEATVIFRIATTDKAFYFGSISTKQPFEDFITSHEYALMETEINKLRNIYKAAKKNKILY